MISNAIKTTLLAGTMFLAVLATLTGCAADETTAPIGSGIVREVTYKPFASGHADKFSLGDFDSPYLVRLDDYTNFVASNSSILLNNTAHEVTKTDYRGGVYLGIAGFSFSDYTDFISTNAALTIKVNLVEANGSVIANETIASGLMVTGATSIYTWQDLQGMKHDLAGGYQLMNSITFPAKDSKGLPPEGFEPVGVDGARFTGSFAGNNHRIVNLSIDRGSVNNVAMWGVVNNANNVIKDFVLDHVGVRGNENVGAVVGALTSGMVSNVGVVSTQNKIVSGTIRVGGLAGINRGTVTGYVTGSVNGNDDVGGLVGNNNGTVNGYATGDVNGDDDVGGLVGQSLGTVNGYATGDVTGDENVGGLVGGNAQVTGVATGYATGRVSGTTDVGGLVGINVFGGKANGYWDITSSMQNASAGGNTVVGISSITNVVYDSGAGTYTDTKGTADDDSDDVEVFDNAAFLMHFTLPGASEAWPILKAEDSFLQP